MSPQPAVATTNYEDLGHARQVRSLIALFGLYAVVLLLVIVFVSDGANIGSVLVAIGGHALYASVRESLAWRETSLLERARIRLLRRRLA
jgi:hypothetical protein